jgi:hypothetical protein
MVPTPESAAATAEELRLRQLQNITMNDLYYSLQRQGDNMTELKRQLESLPALVQSVQLLGHQMEQLNKVPEKLDKVDTAVTVHHTILWLIGALCGIVFPVLVTWNFQLNAELREINSSLNSAKEKITSLERVTYTKP